MKIASLIVKTITIVLLAEVKMDDLNRIEEFYKAFSRNILSAVPEGVTEVNLNVLHKLGLLNYHSASSYDPSLTRYFHVIETKEKITLVNEQFVVWIVPDKINDIAVTYTIIALNKPDGPKPELVFTTRGVYNTSKLVLRILEKYLLEIQENEELMRVLI